jgi:hypothetical protein
MSAPRSSAEVEELMPAARAMATELSSAMLIGLNEGALAPMQTVIEALGETLVQPTEEATLTVKRWVESVVFQLALVAAGAEIRYECEIPEDERRPTS